MAWTKERAVPTDVEFLGFPSYVIYLPDNITGSIRFQVPRKKAFHSVIRATLGHM